MPQLFEIGIVNPEIYHQDSDLTTNRLLRLHTQFVRSRRDVGYRVTDYQTLLSILPHALDAAKAQAEVDMKRHQEKTNP